MNLSPSISYYTLCQLPAPADVGLAMTDVRMLSTCPFLLSVGNQTQKETQKIREGKAEGSLLLLLVSTRVLVMSRIPSPAWRGTTWKSSQGSVLSGGCNGGLHAWLPNRALSQGLPRPVYARLNELSSYPSNLECY